MRGNGGLAPTKTLDEQGLADGGPRFRFIPLHKRLASASARPAALPPVDFRLNLEGVSSDDTTFSHFSATLSSQTDDNITETFTKYVDTVQPLSLSLPLLFRNRVKVVNESLAALEQSAHHAGEATISISACLIALAKDLGSNNFKPFFSCLVATIAHVLSPHHYSPTTDTISVESAEKSSPAFDYTTFWQPDVTLIPLFSILSEVSKLLLPTLINCPHETVAQLAPLIAHHHYRVREMTAESSLGYIIRKIRDNRARDAFISAVVDAVCLDSVTVTDRLNAADGLGFSLFEAARLPSGRLHSRGSTVLQMSIRTLSEDFVIRVDDFEQRKADSIDSDLRLKVVSRCFASLCRFISLSDDVQLVGTMLLTECDSSIYKKDWSQLANILFILRKWIQHGARPLLLSLGLPFSQKILNFVVEAIHKNPEDVRLVCEAFVSICNVYRHTSATFREKSVSVALSSALNNITRGSNVAAHLSALRILLNDLGPELSSSTLLKLTEAVSSVCNQLATTKIVIPQQQSVHEPPCETMTHSLQAALKFFSLLSRGCKTFIATSEFHSPALQAYVLSILQSEAEKNGDLFLTSSSPTMLGDSLEYLSVVNGAECGGLIERLSEQCDRWGFPVCAKFMNACIQQHDVGSIRNNAKLVFSLRKVIAKRLLVSRNAWQNADVCWSMVRFIRCFLKDPFIGLLCEDTLSIQEFRKLLIENISSGNGKLRKASLSLLAELHKSSSCLVKDGEDDHEEDVQVHIQRLRRTLRQSTPSLKDIGTQFLYVLNVSRSLGEIGSRLLLLQEMVRIIDQMKVLDKDVVLMFTHFSFALFQLPLKPIWKSAGDLLCALASLNSSVVMTVVLEKLQWFKSVLLDNLQTIGEGEEGNEEFNDDDSGEINDGSKDLLELKLAQRAHYPKSPTSKTAHSSPNRNESNGGSSKRRRLSVSYMPSKRQKEKIREAVRLHWDPSEWKLYVPSNRGFLFTMPTLPEVGLKNPNEESTDLLTVIVEVVRALTKEPKHVTTYRSDILPLYCELRPNLFSRHRGNLLAMNFALLLEKLGGLKCCEANIELESRMWDCLLSDLCRNAPSLQSAVLRCLCLGRLPLLKSHRDSLLRLIDDNTFREELTLITESSFLSSTSLELGSLNQEEDTVVDIVIRICFSKMSGKKASVDSRKSALLSFITSKLPSTISLQKITSLILAPLDKCIRELEMNEDDDFLPKGNMPVCHVQHGILNSVEVVIKHCRHILPDECWRKMTFAILLLLQRAGTRSVGQNVRSITLRLLSQMIDIRPKDTSFAIMRVLTAMKDIVSKSDNDKGVTRAPALLRLISAIFKTASLYTFDSLFEKHEWTLFFTFRVVQSPECDVNTVDLASDVMTHFLSLVSDKMDKGSNRNDANWSKFCSKAFDKMACTLSDVIPRLASVIESRRSAQRQWSATFNSILEVVERMVGIMPGTAVLFFDLADRLGSFLQNAYLLNVSLSSALKSLSAILRTASSTRSEENREHILPISQLLPLLSARKILRDSESYEALCDLLAAVGTVDIHHIAAILKGLNARSASRIEEIDLDRRIEALNKITAFFKESLGGKDEGLQSNVLDVFAKDETSSKRILLTSASVIALCHGCVASIFVRDTAIRGTAGYALRLVSRWAGFCETGAGRASRSTIYHVLFNAVITAKSLLHRRELCTSLGEFVRYCNEAIDDESSGGMNTFNHLKALGNADVESDFFENLVHLQAHRRGRALHNLEKYINQKVVENMEERLRVERAMSVFCSEFVLPLSMQVALEKPQIEAQNKLKNVKHYSNREYAQKDVSFRAVGVVGAAASRINWQEYKKLFHNLLRRVSSNEDEDDALILYRMLVMVAEVFPKEGEIRFPEGSAAIDFLVNTMLPKMLHHVSAGATNELLHDNEKVSNAHLQLRNERDKSHTIFRAPIAIALGKLMTHLPEKNLDALMPLLVIPLTIALRSRIISTRESAKKALTSVSISLGSKFLPFILRQVFLALNEGFRRDMCIYVIHSLLEGIKKFRKTESTKGASSCFEVDCCVDLIIQQIVDELKNGQSETRKDFEDPNASDIRLKQAAARAAKACECAELLGELVDFQISAKILSFPLLDLLSKTPSGKLISRMEGVVRRLLIGLSKNDSLTTGEALKFCYDFVTQRNTGLSKNPITEGETLEPSLTSPPQLAHVKFAIFGLQFLGIVLSKYTMAFNERSDSARQLLAMSQPFLRLSVFALKTGQDELTLTAFRVLQKLLKLPIAGRAEIASEMSKVIINVLSQNSGATIGIGDYSATNELFNTCLRAAAVLLDEVKDREFSFISKTRVDALLTVARNCIESGSSECRSAAVAIFRSVVSSKIVLPSVYDSIEKVNELAIHAQSASLRSACISISIQFLLSFPLSEKRVEQHLAFFVRNINFELASGRLAALEAIQQVITRFPQNLLGKESEYLFIALTANLARDIDEQCRTLAFECVRSLFGNLLSDHKMIDLLRISMALIGVPCTMKHGDEELVVKEVKDPVVRRSGITSLSAACKSNRLSAMSLKLILRALIMVLDQLSASKDWETRFALLQSVEALFEASDKNYHDQMRFEVIECTQTLWEGLKGSLLHRHQWVRLLAARLMGSHLSACKGRKGGPCEVRAGRWMIWNRNHLVRDWIKACCLQLEADQLSMELGQQCLKNILCMADVVEKHPLVGDIGVVNSEVEDRAELRDVEEIEVDETGTCNIITGQAKYGRMLRWLLSRMCGIALKGGQEEHDFLRRACGLRFLLVLTKWWGREVIYHFKTQYIWPVVKVLESGQTDVSTRRETMRKARWSEKRFNPDLTKEQNGESVDGEPVDDQVDVKALKTIAEALQKALVETIGNEAYYEVYHDLRSRLAAVKLDRKRKAAMMIATDPERAAKRKRVKARLRNFKKRGKNVTRPMDSEGDVEFSLEKCGEHNNCDTRTYEKTQHARRMLTEDL